MGTIGEIASLDGGVDYGKMGIQEKSKHLRGKLIYGPVYGRIGTGKSGNIKKISQGRLAQSFCARWKQKVLISGNR